MTIMNRRLEAGRNGQSWGSHRFIVLIIVASILTSGCQSHTINPSPEPLQKGGVAYSITSPTSKPVDYNWWASFKDAKLDALIDKALDSNFDIMRGLALDDLVGTTKWTGMGERIGRN